MSRPLIVDLAPARGLITRAALRAAGHSARTISAAVASGELLVPRRGWLAATDAPPQARRAVQLGGVLGGASALASWGIWVDVEPELIVSCRPNGSRMPPLGAGERRIWLAEVAPHASKYGWRVSVVDALLQLSLCVPRDSLIASIDSAIEKNLLDEAALSTLLHHLPARLKSIEREIDGTAMSGTETHMRLGLRRRGHRVETQVGILSVGTVDIVVDEWLIIELDSRKHHAGVENQTKDRRRDGNAVLGRFGHERFMWSQVFYDLDWCLDVVEARLREGRPVPNSG